MTSWGPGNGFSDVVILSLFDTRLSRQPSARTSIDQLFPRDVSGQGPAARLPAFGFPGGWPDAKGRAGTAGDRAWPRQGSRGRYRFDSGNTLV